MATEEERRMATERAEHFQLSLGDAFPSFVKPMLYSNVTRVFWLGLPKEFCKDHLPRNDAIVTLVDFRGVRFHIMYIARFCALSGGWRAFASHHNLMVGDTCVFERTGPTVLKVIIQTLQHVVSCILMIPFARGSKASFVL
ncbi:hypothetical protein MKW94_004573 [Papaver nudicaule]|uniref:TF-B3 domain-containing protein n=1 Tax=Papaver nudicaule TaxID=74823 RepID=A0AA41VLQ4_PAPNU|nr:hypothetical protein [Papaver nudicaule]